MNRMQARFTFDGVPPNVLVVGDSGGIVVTLETDGYAVRIVPSINQEPRCPVLTPEGWMNLAHAARRLTDRANEAWKAIEAVPNYEGVE